MIPEKDDTVDTSEDSCEEGRENGPADDPTIPTKDSGLEMCQWTCPLPTAHCPLLKVHVLLQNLPKSNIVEVGHRELRGPRRGPPPQRPHRGDRACSRVSLLTPRVRPSVSGCLYGGVAFGTTKELDN